MKKILLFALLFVSLNVFGQSEYKAENEGWLVDIQEAHALSQKTGKPILANFTGSDWCGWCKRLTASVFSKEEFKKWADDNVVLLELDYPRRKSLPDNLRAQNEQLRQAFQIRGFPTVWVFKLEQDETSGQMNIEGLGKTGYRRTVKEFTTDINQMIAKNGK